ncbi:unnamed protein product [Parnassius apollo]|uniref:(apollo) hypothetical protein n=1 Tax=Parnassius apollo TaxID=110799 RepID=A0A8S3Y9N2_PARAO|nr:unnamed protein product [Parnassius apollo]
MYRNKIMKQFFSLFLGSRKEIDGLKKENKPKKRLFERSVNQNPQRQNAVLLLKYSTAFPFKTRFNRIICSYCHDEFEPMAALREHIKAEHSNADFNSAFYKVVDDLKIDISQFKCNLCSQDMLNVETFMMHISRDHSVSVNFDVPFGVLPYRQGPTGLWMCLDCDKTFTEFSQINGHLRSHVKIFTCDKCGATFLSEHGLRQHERRFKCYKSTYKPRFGKTLKHRSNTEIILQCSTACPFRTWGLNFNCVLCRVQSNDPNGLRTHMATRHANFDIQLVFSRKLRKEFLKVDISDLQCKLCFIRIDTLDDLMTHLKNDHKQPINFDVQPGVLPFKLNDGSSWKCAICKMQFPDFISLKKHTAEHYQNFVCDTCGEGFITESALIAHTRIPHGNKYSCSRCVATFSTLEERNVHIKTQHTTLPYMCMHCKDKPRFGDQGQMEDESIVKVETNDNIPLGESINLKEKRRYIRSARAEARIVTKRNAKSLLECWSLCPFRWQRNRFKCAFCEESFIQCNDLREHVNECSSKHNVKDIYSKFKEMSLINVDITGASCRLCRCPYSGINQMRQHAVQHGYEFNTSQPDGVLPFSLDKECWRCVICHEDFNNFLKLYEHMNVHYQHYICSTCGKGYMTAPRLRKHSEVHITGSFPCDKCDRAFTMRAARDHHKAHAHAKGPRYECPHCNMRFNGYYDRMNHLNETHREKEVSYRCNVCELTFKTSGRRAMHIRTVHLPQPRNFACPYCEWFFKTRYELKRHMVKHTGERNYSCTICGKAYPRNRALRTHLKTHEDLTCKWCGAFFKQRAQLLTHTRINHPDLSDLIAVGSDKIACSANAEAVANVVKRVRKLKENVSARQMRRRRRANNQLPEESERRISKTMMRRNTMAILECSTAWAFRWFRNAFFCSYCDEKFVDPQPLREHVLSSHISCSPTVRIFSKLTENNMVKIDITNLRCRLCNYGCNNIDALKNHLKTAHRKTLNSEYSDGVLPFKLDEIGFYCQACFEYFTSFAKLNEHMNSHYQNYICDACGKAFISKSRFRTHVESHEIGSFPCGECDEVLQTRAARTCHRMKVHRKGIRYTCPRCPAVFTAYYARARHLVDGHAQQRMDYDCTTCGKTFETSCKRAAHIRVAHMPVEKRYECLYCPSYFVSKSKLRRQEEITPDTSVKEKLNIKWKKIRRVAEDKANAAIILQNSNAVAFRWHRGRFMCAYCPLICTSVTEIRLHSNEHANKQDIFLNSGVRNSFPLRVDVTDLTCMLCFDRIENLENFKVHLSNNHDKFLNPDYSDGLVPFVLTGKDYKCVNCGTLFENFMSLYIHMNEHYQTYVCYTCGKGPKESNVKWKPRRKFNDHRDNAAIILECSNACPFRWKSGAFVCAFCPNSFGDFTGVREHTSEHPNRVEAVRLARPFDTIKADITNLRCDLCLQIVKDLDELADHLINGHEKPIVKDRGVGITPFYLKGKEFICSHCSEHFDLFTNLNTHMNQHYKNNICYKCGKAFSASHRLHAHMVTHELEDDGFKCTKCDDIFATRKLRSSHMSYMHGPKLRYRCPYCKDKFKAYGDRAKHLKEVHDRKVEYPCHLCPAVFALCNQRTKHIQQVHIKHKPFQCEYCVFKSSTAARLRSHLVKHIGIRKYQCDICKKAYCRIKTLREHMRIHNNDKRFVCEYCNAAFVQKCSLQRRKCEDIQIKQEVESDSENIKAAVIVPARDAGNERRAAFRNNIKIILESCTACPFKYRKGTYLCFFCKTSFLEPERLREHTQQLHSDVKQLLKPRKYEPLKMDFAVTTCKMCGTAIPDYEMLKSHLRDHGKVLDCTHGDSVLPYSLSKDDHRCQICGKRYEMFLSLHKHMNDHYEHFICETCGKRFATSQRMVNHARTHERGEFPCKRCQDSFPSYASLYAHIAKVHRSNKRYKCPICDEKFASYKHRLKHLNTVHGEKTAIFPCPSCPRVFDLCSRRTAHIRFQHLQERNHSCSLCFMKFFTKYELQEHSIKHGGERIYQCDVCKKSYARLKTLREHMRIHNNDRRFVCPVCGQAFIQNCSLKQHVRVHHPSHTKTDVF